MSLLKGFGPVVLTMTLGWYSFSIIALDAVTNSPWLKVKTGLSPINLETVANTSGLKQKQYSVIKNKTQKVSIPF